MKKMLTLIIVLLLMVGCTTGVKSTNDTSLNDLLERNVFRIGFTNYPPFGMIEKGVAKGFDIDMAKEVAKRLGVEFDYKYIDWDTKQFELDSGNIDAIWIGFTITPKRGKEVTFSKPYFDNYIVMM